MKRILIDYTYYQHGTFHGGGEYGDTIIRRLLCEKNAQFGLFYYDNLECKDDLLTEASNANWEIFSISSFNELPELITQYGYDTFFSPLPYQADRQGVILPPQVNYIGTYHGLRQLELTDYSGIMKGEYFGLNDTGTINELTDFYGTLIKNASKRKIITDSRHSKYSLLKYYPFLEDNEVEVLYPPMKKKGVINSDEDAVLSALQVTTNYFSLMVSGNIYYKNVLRAAIAYDHFFSRCPDRVGGDYRVIITGIDTPDSILSQVANKTRFIILPYLSAELLEILYKNAHTFVFPSFNEGFGYPPLRSNALPCSLSMFSFYLTLRNPWRNGNIFQSAFCRRNRKPNTSKFF